MLYYGLRSKKKSGRTKANTIFLDQVGFRLLTVSGRALMAIFCLETSESKALLYTLPSKIGSSNGTMLFILSFPLY